MRMNASSIRIICIRLNFIKQLTESKCKNQKFQGVFMPMLPVQPVQFDKLEVVDEAIAILTVGISLN